MPLPRISGLPSTTSEHAPPHRKRRSAGAGPALLLVAAAALGAWLAPARASAESCTSSDPSQWPAPSKPYFMVVVDTSGSMTTSVTTGTNSCGYDHNRIGDARCAVKKTIEAFGGEVSFGLATYAWKTDCSAGCGASPICDTAGGTNPNPCINNCNATLAPGDDITCGPVITEPTLNAALNSTNNTGSGGLNLSGTQKIHAGGLVAVPLVQDNFWSPPLNPPNFSSIYALTDDTCTDATLFGYEIYAYSRTPLGGVLYNMLQYFSGTYTDPFTFKTLPTPIGPTTFNGQPAERPCRSVNVILITDGDETCDAYNCGAYSCNNGNGLFSAPSEGLAVYEAGRLLAGVTPTGSPTFNVKTYVIGFAGASTTALNHIATAGGTTASYSVNNETQLAQALSGIIGASIKPETCNNADDNCNGCVDEGFQHFCDVPSNLATCCAWKTLAQKATCGAAACACCNWTTTTERAACLGGYTASITATNPKGDQTLLPCTTATQAQSPSTWLCYDPGDVCDDLDNNCNGVVDENQLKCGSPLHCPEAEVCNGLDDNCDGIVDNAPGGGSVCSSTCLVSSTAEVCDGCDNDCDGIIDNGVSVSIPCGPPSGPTEPSYCQGTITCKPPQPAPQPGACVAGAGFTACTYSITPPAETCNGLDDDCNGIVDDNVPSVPCVPPGTPAGLVFGGNSQCVKGTTQCVNGAAVCVGFVGPSAEVCDGIDNNCDGTVDNGVSGVGLACGKSQPPCTPGVTACVAGTLVCTGGVQPQPEICDGIDNDCNGQIDDGALADAPAPGMNGCWDLPGNCCSFADSQTGKTTTWCPPPGATCNDLGSLAAPSCSHGVLGCQAGAWVCKGAKDPSPEVCDGIDNDCDGVVDNGVTNVGTACGSNVGECKPGTLQCNAGVLSCVGGVFPMPEVCDGKDNDCDGVIDNGIPTGGACAMPYDTAAYPGDRSRGACKPGVTQCDGNGGVTCVGGVGPSPEVCDGIDNDCDGQVDEVGAPPDGINGTASPLGSPAGKIGDACGVTQGECQAGAYACLNGQLACVGGKGAQPEECDCKDNDCDGVIDNQTPGGPPLCSAGKDCVKSSFGCGCAAPCDQAKEFPCPGGQVCQDVTDSNGTPKGQYCVSDPCPNCEGATVTDANKKVVCAPAGTPADPATCVAPPVCVCKGMNGCRNPCYGVTCGPGTVCAERGPNAGSCVADSCFATPCQGCSTVCNLGSCVPSPCQPSPCKADEECRPTADFASHTCVASCAGVTCPKGRQCVAGTCVAGCDPACASGQACDTSQSPPVCVKGKCDPNPCTNGSFCDPSTGACGNDPCAGVVCPASQVCQGGSCFAGQAGAGGGTSSSSSGGTGTSSSTTSGGVGPSTNQGVWGLATGGGGCSCEVGPGASRRDELRWALAALAVALAARRRRRDGAGEEVSR